MKLTKFGHSCFLIEEKGLRVLMDPGSYSALPSMLENIDVILITHEHQDHVEMGRLKTVLGNNPHAKILTNKGVGVLLEKEGIPFGLLEGRQEYTEKGVLIEGMGTEHALIHASIPRIPNTGYWIANRLFYPGDALTNPGKPVEILALPVAAPWMKMAETIDYALQVKPRVCVAAHDGFLTAPNPFHGLCERTLKGHNIRWVVPTLGEKMEF